MGKHSPWTRYHSKTWKCNLELNFIALNKMQAIGKKLWLKVKITQQRLGSNRAGKWVDMIWVYLALSFSLGQGKAALIDPIVSLEMVFHDQIPDLLLFWDLSFFHSGKRPLRTCCHNFRKGWAVSQRPQCWPGLRLRDFIWQLLNVWKFWFKSLSAI